MSYLNRLKVVFWVIVIGLWSSQHTLGQAPIEKEKLARANQLYTEALKEHDTLKLAEAYYRFGAITNGQSQQQRAVGWFTKALELYLKTGNYYKAGRIHIYLATFDFENGNLSGGLTYLEKAEKLFVKAKSEQGLMMVYGGLGRVYSQDWSMKDPRLLPKDSAIVYLQKAERIAQRIDPKALPELRHYIGYLLVTKRDSSALGYLEAVVRDTEAAYEYRVALPPLHAKLDLARAYVVFHQFG